MNNAHFMAQTIQLPLDILFLPTRRKWEVRHASVVELTPPENVLSSIKPLIITESLLTGPPRIGLQIEPRERNWLSGLMTKEFEVVPLGHAARVLELYAPDGKVLSGAYGVPMVFDVLISYELGAPVERSRDPWRMRGEFLELDQTASELAKFLTKWGDWDFSFLRDVASYTAGEARPEKPLGIAVPELLWERQTFYKAALSGKPVDWLRTHAQVPKPQRQLNAPFFALVEKVCSTLR